MSSRNNLVSRARNGGAASSPAPGSRQRQSRAPETAEPTPLPPYEPPSCPLSDAAKKKLESLQLDQTKYSKHLEGGRSTITLGVRTINERLAARKHEMEELAEKDQNQDKGDVLAEHEKAAQYLASYEKQVVELTTKAEAAMRELIDYGDELTQQKNFVREAATKAAAAGDRAPADDAEVTSALEALNAAKEKHSAAYSKRTMREKYADHNDYKDFKRNLHDAQHSIGDSAPPLPHPRSWFPEEIAPAAGSSRRRRNNTTDHTNNGEDDEDDEIIIASIKENMKCPLSFQYLKEPMTSNKCKHSFEKVAVSEYFNSSSAMFYQNAAGTRVPTGTRTAPCPQSGCNSRFGMEDLFLDKALQRRVELHIRREKRAAENDGASDDEAAPRGTQAGRPEEIDDDDDDDGIEIDDEEERRKEIRKIKKERASRGPSMAPSRTQNSTAGDEDEMDLDD